jgi:hypothetical protein
MSGVAALQHSWVWRLEEIVENDEQTLVDACAARRSISNRPKFLTVQ